MNRNTALLLIDVQNNVLRGVGSPNKMAETGKLFDATIQRLALVKQQALSAGIPVIIIKHAGTKGHRLETGSEGWQIHPLLEPGRGALVVSKVTSDSFYETNLLEELNRLQITNLVVGGFLTQYCVDLTVRRAVMLGFDVTLLSDGHSTCDENGLSCEQIIAHHNNILPVFTLNGHGVALQSSETVIASLALNQPQGTN